MLSLIQHLNNLLEYYLEPLKSETFLTGAEINVLFGNIVEIINFQRQFLENLNGALEAEKEFYEFDKPNQFKVIFSLFRFFHLKSLFTYYYYYFLIPINLKNSVINKINFTLLLFRFHFLSIFYFRSAARSCITSTTSNCTAHFAPAIRRLKKF